MGGEPLDLLSQYQQGDSDALPKLVESMGPRLRGYFLRQGAQPSTADDLVQDVFLRVLRSIDRYRPTGRPDAYLLRIARNLWIDSRRRRRPVASDELAKSTEDTQPGPLLLADEQDRGEQLRKALATADEADQELLELAVLQRLPYREVGVILDIPVGTVKSRVYYALRRLRNRVTELDPSKDS